MANPLLIAIGSIAVSQSPVVVIHLPWLFSYFSYGFLNHLMHDKSDKLENKKPKSSQIVRNLSNKKVSRTI